jgi:hypothetical protein
MNSYEETAPISPKEPYAPLASSFSVTYTNQGTNDMKSS